jgi:threonine/homoserine/homoserine lactone efflux protein
MIFKGFKFGMLLQLAVGPVCLLVFNTATRQGFWPSLFLVAAATLVDALYIALSSVGVASIINKVGVKTTVKVVGCLVLVLFGLDTLSGAFGFSFLPSLSLFSSASNQNLFVQGFLLTASNPLTIVFWSGMFSAQMLENHWSTHQLFFFAVGCVLATILFLTTAALLGSFISDFLPAMFIRVLNGVVGAFLIFFGLRLLLRKEKGQTTQPQIA